MPFDRYIFFLLDEQFFMGYNMSYIIYSHARAYVREFIII